MATDTTPEEAEPGKPPAEPGEEDVLTDRGRSDAARVHERWCIVTRQRRPTARMIRFVPGPSGEVAPDLAAKLPGRGAWLSAERSVVEKAVRSGVFARAFRRPVVVPDGLVDRIEALIETRALERLGLARRSGEVVAGQDQVMEEIRRAAPAAVIEAADGAEDGRRRVLALLRAAHGKDGAGPLVVGCFTSEQLGMALGRTHVIHACLKRGRFAEAWIDDVTRLAGFRMIRPPEWRSGTDR